MKYFKSLLGVVPRVARTISDVAAASVSVKRTEHATLSTSDKLKLVKPVSEGRDKFTFFKTNVKSGSDFVQYTNYIYASKL